MKKRIWIGVRVALTVAFVVFFTLHQHSLSIALKANGYRMRQIVDGESSFHEGDQPYLIVQADSDDGAVALIRAEKDFLGFWHVEDVCPVQEDWGFASMVWHKRGGLRTFGPGDEGELAREWHIAYCGNNAVAKIEIQPDQLPSNCTVNIRQIDQFYLIHVIRFSNEGLYIDMHELLLKNGFIALE